MPRLQFPYIHGIALGSECLYVLLSDELFKFGVFLFESLYHLLLYLDIDIKVVAIPHQRGVK